MSAHDDLNALRRTLRASEQRIREVINQQFHAISGEFGITPDSVSVDVFEVTTIGSPEAEYVVGSVRLSVTL